MSLSPENRALVEEHVGPYFANDPPSWLNTLLDAARSHESERVKGLEEALGTCAWQLEMLSTDWRADIPGAIAVQCEIKAKIARSALSAIPGEAVLAGEGETARVPSETDSD